MPYQIFVMNYQYRRINSIVGAVAFEKRSRHSENIKFRKLTDKVEKLESKLFYKDQVIAEITEDYVKLKKNFGEI
jgi:hypothetical protein